MVDAQARRGAEEDAGRLSREPVRLSDEHPWFSQPPVVSLPPPPLSTRPPPPPIGDARWSAILGAVAGGIGGFTMLIVVDGLLGAAGSEVDAVHAVGTAIAGELPGVDARIVGLVCAAWAGAFVGAPLGHMARRMLRLLPRIVFFCLFVPVLWIFGHALILKLAASGQASQLPLWPLLAGAAGYGLCLAIVKPIRAR